MSYSILSSGDSSNGFVDTDTAAEVEDAGIAQTSAYGRGAGVTVASADFGPDNGDFTNGASSTTAISLENEVGGYGSLSSYGRVYPDADTNVARKYVSSSARFLFSKTYHFFSSISLTDPTACVFCL